MGKSIKKKVLFLGVGLYNYDNLICDELSKKYDVTYIYLVPVKKIPKWKYFIFSHLGQKEYIRKLNSKLLMDDLEREKSTHFDYIFVIKGSRLEDYHMKYIDDKFPAAKKVLYLWDSWSLIENQSVLRKYFDNVYSFDSEDCKKYGFTFRPLFYAKQIDKTQVKEYDVSFIGTDHSDRLEKLRAFRLLCENNGLKCYLRLKTTGFPMMCAWLNYGRYKKNDLDMFTNRFMSYNETMEIISKSRTVIDFSHPAQCGLTIRTLESLAMGCKLLTSNKYIKEYEDIPSNFYCVISETDEKALISFLNSSVPLISLPEKYSISSFINDLLC